jgi:hypothetical protein
MSKFRKRPIVVEAVQWINHGDHPAVVALPPEHPVELNAINSKVFGWVPTLEGGYVVSPGDWIITGVKGEIYPCKPDIFEATYEPAD